MTPITTTEALRAFCQRLADQPFITVDTEFMRETTYWPRLCLIQAASATDAALIDPMAEGLDLEPFLDLLRDPKIIKVFHAARQDTEIFVKLGAMPKPMFDTQVAAMAAGFGDQVSYEALVRQMLKQEVDKGSRFTDWARRPLSEAQLVYALGDVTHLAALYPKLRDRLQKEGRLDWVMSEMESLTDPDLYDTDPERPGSGSNRRSSAPDTFQPSSPRRSGASAPPRNATSRAAASSRTRPSTRSRPRGRPIPTPSTACAPCPRVSVPRDWGWSSRLN